MFHLSARLRNATRSKIAWQPVRLTFAASLLIIFSVQRNAWSQNAPATTGNRSAEISRKTAGVPASYGKLPLSFEANEGQADPRVRFVSHGNGYSLLLTSDEAVLALNKGDGQSGEPPAIPRSLVAGASRRKAEVVAMQLSGARQDIDVRGTEKLPGIANYFIGKNPADWRTNIPTYRKVKYSDVYPGIDLIYYGNQRQLEYDFVIAPGAHPETIWFRMSGARKLALDSTGNLEALGPDGKLVFEKPVIYQRIAGRRRSVDGGFTLMAGNAVGFTVGAYDHSTELVIDPTLVYATYLGGSGQGGRGSFDDNGYSIAVNSSGDAYVAGDTWSENFPVTANSYHPGDTGLTDGFFQTSSGFITKLNAAGSALAYSTYIGGNGSSGFTGDSVNGGGGDTVNAIFVDSAGNAYLAGSTWSQNFPTTDGAYQSTNKSFPYGFSAWVAKLNPAGNSLIYSTLIGGTAQQEGNNDYGDSALGIAVNTSGDAYVTGFTTSTDFPTTSRALQKVNHAASATGANAWVAEVNSSGTGLVYSTYLGGSGIASKPNSPARDAGVGIPGDSATGIALDGEGQAFVTGYTLSTDFPVTPDVFQTKNKAAALGVATGFVAEVNSTGSKLVYSTYLGGSGHKVGDIPNGISLDSQGNVYVTGATGSSDYPTSEGSFQDENEGTAGDVPNAFVTKLNPSGTKLVYSTLLGGTGSATDGDRAEAIVVDSSGNAYVTGYACSTDFPVTHNAYQAVNKAAASSGANAFLTEINADGKSLIYSTYLGGSAGGSGPVLPAGGDVSFGIALDKTKNVYLVGDTYSSDFPVTKSAYQKTNKGAPGGNSNLFIAKFDLSSPTTPPATAVPKFSLAGGTYHAEQTVGITDETSGAVIYYTLNGATPGASSTRYTAKIKVARSETIKAIAIAPSHSKSSVVSETYDLVVATPKFSLAAGTYKTHEKVTITDATPGAVIHCTTNGTTPTSRSPACSKAIAVDQTMTIKAIAIAAGFLNSTVVTEKYVISLPPAATTKAATAIRASATTLNAILMDEDVAGTVWFAHGTSKSALTSLTKRKAIAASTASQNISEPMLPDASMDLPERTFELLRRLDFGLSTASLELIGSALRFETRRGGPATREPLPTRLRGNWNSPARQLGQRIAAHALGGLINHLHRTAKCMSPALLAGLTVGRVTFAAFMRPVVASRFDL